MSSFTCASLLLALGLCLGGCGRTDADLEIDLRRGDGGFWNNATGGKLDVTMCATPWDGGLGDPDADVSYSDCLSVQNKEFPVFADGERDLVGIYLDGNVGMRVFWTITPSGTCWALEVLRPGGQRLQVTLPAGPGRLLSAPDCVPPKCQIRACK